LEVSLLHCAFTMLLDQTVTPFVSLGYYHVRRRRRH
jgi:hypothetical protein